MTEAKSRTETNNEVADFFDKHPECEHFWQIDAPNGPISEGTCDKCKQTREFQNSIQTSGWDRGNSAARKKAAEAASARSSGNQTETAAKADPNASKESKSGKAAKTESKS